MNAQFVFNLNYQSAFHLLSVLTIVDNNGHVELWFACRDTAGTKRFEEDWLD